jgi:hypothetical protein
MFKMNALIVLESAIILLLLGTAHTQGSFSIQLDFVEWIFLFEY